MEASITIKPVEVVYPSKWTLPVIFSSPHSGSYYPDSFIKQVDLDLLSLRQSEDYRVDELFSAAPLFGAPLLKSNYPRAYCDPNRQAYELDPSMFAETLPKHVITSSARISAGIGTIPKIVAAGKQICSAPLTYQEVNERLELCYFPYHAALKGLLNQGIEKFGKVLLIDCHSMPAASTYAKTKAIPALSDFILGDRYGNTCPAEYSTLIAHKLKSFGHTVSYNSPYAGGYITQHYSNTYKEVSALQIEINRNLYMEQSTLTATPNMPMLKNQLSELIDEIGTIFRLKKTG